jgi:hypothetical protein
MAHVVFGLLCAVARKADVAQLVVTVHVRDVASVVAVFAEYDASAACSFFTPASTTRCEPSMHSRSSSSGMSSAYTVHVPPATSSLVCVRSFFGVTFPDWIVIQVDAKMSREWFGIDLDYRYSVHFANPRGDEYLPTAG